MLALLDQVEKAMAGAYLVQLPSTGRFTLPDGVDNMVIYAGSSAEALDRAKGEYSGDSDAAWAAATATLIDAGADWSDFELHIAVLDASPLIEVRAQPDGIAVTAGAINAGGTGYSDNDIVTVGGGTFTRAATFRVVSQSAGVVTAIEVVDPGEYTVLPSNPASVTGGTGGNDLTIDLTGSANAFESMLANAVSLLNADAQIAGAAIDMGAGSAPLLTIASGSGGSGGSDDLGDKTLVVEMLYVNGSDKTAVSALVGTVTDGGVSTADLSAEFNASPVVPNVVAKLKS